MPDNHENPGQMQFGLPDCNKPKNVPEKDVDYWPTPEQIEDRRLRISIDLAKPLISNPVKIIPIVHEKKAEAIDSRRIEQLESNAVRIFPRLFASKPDLTERLEADIDSYYRDGTGQMTYPRAFKAVMGYPMDTYNQLSNEPKYTFESKSPIYIETAEKIFADPNPNKKMKKQLKDMISEHIKLRINILGLITKGGEEKLPQDDASELIEFASLRIEELNCLKNKA